MKFVCYLVGLFSLVFIASCTSEQQMKDQIIKVLKDNPEVLAKAIEAHPVEFMEAVQNAAKKAQGDMAKKKDEEEKKEMEAMYDSPLQAEIRADESIRGTKGAPLTLIEYSDFECPFCGRGYSTVMELLKKYEGKIQFIYKHLPLSFHQQAKISAQYYEAIRLQNPELAWKFHDTVYKDQGKLRNGENYLKSLVKDLKGIDIKKLEKDLNSKAVLDRIEADEKEAAKFGFQGTPGFLLNGVPVKGAYPFDHFVGIVDELTKRGKVKL